jgi:prepilin peptidase CpaA
MTSFPVSQFARSPLGLLAGACFVLALAIASATDIRSRRISNRLVLTLGLLGLVYSVLSVSFSVGLARALVSGLLGFLLWIPFYALRMLGAGDVKLFAAASFWLAPSQVLSAALVSAFAGGVLSVIGLVLAHGFGLATLRMADIARDPKVLATPLAVPSDRKTLPYGLAMTVGLAMAAWYPRLLLLS